VKLGEPAVNRDDKHAREKAKHDGAVLTDGGQRSPLSHRLARAGAVDAASAEVARRMLRIAMKYLPLAHADLDFAFRLDGIRQPDGTWQLSRAGHSPRYAAITALGLARLPAAAQRTALSGATASDLIGHLGRQLPQLTSLGDVAMVCWAAAEASHQVLPQALARLSELDPASQAAGDSPPPVVDSAWTVSALVAARSHADVEAHLDRARQRLLAVRGPGAYPHLTGPGGPWHRSHVGSFADQIYPVQALARLHASADDKQALEGANAIAGAICDAQGDAGQWWWHYDSRTGAVVEGYPVYSVHQHAMAPMGLLDLADAGGDDHVAAVCAGLRWLTEPPETAEPLVLDDPPVAWRKVARSDSKKLVRGMRATSTRVHPRIRLSPLDQVFRPGRIDHECRPYELGWLPVAWL
jgi:hypothetical protein